MKHILQVLKFEYIGCVKSKSFIVSTVIFMAMIIFMTILPGIIMTAMNSESSEDSDSEASQPIIAFSDKAYNDDEAITKLLQKYYPAYAAESSKESIDEIKTKVDEGVYSFAVVINEPLSYTYITKNNSLMTDNVQILSQAIKELFQQKSLKNVGVDEKIAAEIVNASPTMTTITTGKDQTQNYFPTYILTMILYMAVIMYGQMVSQSVVSEKNTRAMEMLITCAKPSHLMFGKVLGSGLAGLTQLVLILSTAVVSVNSMGSNAVTDIISEYINFPVATVLYALLFFILGFFIYSFLLGALSSLASRSEDLNTLISPIMILLVAAFMIVIFAINTDAVNGTLMVVCSYIPFTAPIAMFARIALTDVSIIEIILSIVVQIISIYLLGMLAAAIYKIGVLLYGNVPKPNELIKLLKEQHKSNSHVKSRHDAE